MFKALRKLVMICVFKEEETLCHRWLVGLVVWFSPRVWEVPGSTPGRALLYFEPIPRRTKIFAFLPYFLRMNITLISPRCWVSQGAKEVSSLKGQCHEKSCSAEACGDAGLDPDYWPHVDFTFSDQLFICYDFSTVCSLCKTSFWFSGTAAFRWLILHAVVSSTESVLPKGTVTRNFSLW